MWRGVGGPPNGSYILTPEGVEQHYAVQVLSRFILAHTLALDPDPVVKKSVLSVAAPGYRYPAVDFGDLDLHEANEKGRYGIRVCVARDSVFLDTFTEVCLLSCLVALLNSKPVAPHLH